MKLCECGCGESAPISSQTRARYGYFKGQPIRFRHGHAARVQSTTTRAKNSASKLGSKNPNWKGHAATYSACHQWLNENQPKTNRCAVCLKQTKTEYAYLGSNGKWMRDIRMYVELCNPCHQDFDNKKS